MSDLQNLKQFLSYMFEPERSPASTHDVKFFARARTPHPSHVSDSETLVADCYELAMMFRQFDPEMILEAATKLSIEAAKPPAKQFKVTCDMPDSFSENKENFIAP